MRECVRFLQVGFRVSERRACRVVGVRRSSYRVRCRARDQTPLLQRIRENAATRVRYGYRRVHTLLRREGWHVNVKRVYRLYRRDGLSLRLKARKKPEGSGSARRERSYRRHKHPTSSGVWIS